MKCSKYVSFSWNWTNYECFFKKLSGRMDNREWIDNSHEKMWYFVRLAPICTIKNVKNSHGKVLLLVKLQAETCNFTKSNTLSWVLLTFFKLHKWYQIAQPVSNCLKAKRNAVITGRFYHGVVRDDFT